MQTDLLTTTTQSMFGVTNPVGVTYSGTGEGQVDFGLFLMSLLSMESLPTDIETVAGEEPESSGGATLGFTSGGVLLDGNNGGGTLAEYTGDPKDLLLTALLTGKQAIPPQITDEVFGAEPRTGLPLEQTGYAMEAPEHTPIAQDLRTMLTALTSGTVETSNITGEPVKNQVIMPSPETPETNVTSGQPSALPVPAIQPVVELMAGIVSSEMVKQPVPETTPLTGGVVSENPIDLTSSRIGEPVLPTGNLRSLVEQVMPEGQVFKSASLPAGAVELTADRPTGNFGIDLAGTTMLSAKAEPLSVLAGEVLLPKSPQVTPVVSPVEQQLPREMVVENAVAGTPAKNIAELFPQTTIEALKVPGEKPQPVKPDLSAGSQKQSSSRPQVITAQAVAAAQSSGQKQQQQTLSEFNREFSQDRQPALQPKAEVATSSPGLPGGTKIKTLAAPIQLEADGKPVTQPAVPEVAVSVKTEVAAAKTEGLQRAQFVIEPESLRSPIKPPAEIRLRLIPESLGLMKLTIRAMENHLTARVVVQSQAAQMSVEGNLAELQRTMADAGLVIDKFDVTVGHTAGATATHPDANPQKRRYAYRQKANRRYQEAAGVKKSDVVGSSSAGAGGVNTGPGTLNMLA